MRSILLAVKIAILFAVLHTVVLLGIFWLFMHTAGHQLLAEHSSLLAYEGVAVADGIESALGDGEPRPDVLRALLATESDGRLFRMRLRLPHDPPVVESKRSRRLHAIRHRRDIDVLGRVCHVIGPPFLETSVPIFHQGQEVARLIVEERFHSAEVHEAFSRGLLGIGTVTLLAVVALAVYLAAPLRRMSRSMDRIAAGDLEHRLVVRGRDEVAAMGRSFNAMADRIRDMLMGQKELMAGVSHELRSPLARMKLGFELLRGGDARAERLAELESEIDVIDALVEELLLASRFELGSVPLDLRRLELGELAVEAWKRVASVAAERGMTLELELDEAALSVAADRALTVRVLGNLFENAVRHARQGAVILSARPHGERVEVIVADHGPGVEDAELERLFEPFYRTDRSRSRATGAGGLGLMIVRRAVAAQGGAVRAERAASGGLKVVFDLPLSAPS